MAYTQIHDRYLELKKTLGIENPGHLGLKCRKADAKITLCEAACLVVLFQTSRDPHFKHFLDWNRPALLRLFPTLPSYARLAKWMGKAEQLLLDLARSTTTKPGDRTTIYAIDSTPKERSARRRRPSDLR